MERFDAGDITLERVDEYIWEIPRDGDMRVPARVFASEALLEEISEDKTLEQLRNATELPGITKYALCMPDGHQGYGFPVGGVGAMDTETGCISPGAIGYDINCLSGEAEIRLEFGRRIRLDELADRFHDERATVAGDRLRPSPIKLFTETPGEQVYEIETTTGETLRGTKDHPFLTPHGMTELGELTPGDRLRIHPFRGLPAAPAEEFTILEASDFEDEDPELVGSLEDRGVLPLRSTDDVFCHLLKLVGYHTGDGSFDEREGHTRFYGDPDDLDRIADDIRTVGFTPACSDDGERTHEVDGDTSATTEYTVRTTSTALMRVLQKLGAPTGDTVESDHTVPWYLGRLPGWQQALYLSALFGAELSSPAPTTEGTLPCLTISQNRVPRHEGAGEAFLRGIARCLEELGIETTAIERFPAASTASEETAELRLGIENDSENLIRFFSTVGYRYDREKQRTAIKALQYLKTNATAVERGREFADAPTALADGGTGPTTDCGWSDRETHRCIRDESDTRTRPSEDVPGFEEFCEELAVDDNLTVAATVRTIEPAGVETVYDLGVEHDAHNFIANGYVVSNCGVRMVTTNLQYDDIQGREEELVEALFANIPSGLGGGGVVETDMATIDELLSRGVEWAVDNGWGVEEDLAHCEDEGARPEADPAAVSERAKNRGKNQVGSLGSGNHFLEVQRVTDIFRPEIAAEYGLSEEQVVVLIHCGSRGLGHQVCTDYLRKIEQQHGDLLADLPDKELAAAPAGSDLADEYYQAMGAAINFAWTNRQLIMHRTRQVFEEVFDRTWRELEMDLLYDVAHNIGKKEVHDVDGQDKELYVHRKGATRAFPAGRPEIPAAYRDVGQPVIIPGSMGTGSYVLCGGERSMGLSFGSTAHGAGRLMSRTEAKQTYWGGDVQDELRTQNQIYVKAQSGATVAEEAPGVYKDVDEVVRVSEALGIGDSVARTFPICNIKG